MKRSPRAWTPVQACLAWLFTLISIRSCLGQFAVSSPGGAVASAGGVTVVAELPGFGVINGLLNAMQNNNRFEQQQQFERLQQGRPGVGNNRRGMGVPKPGFGPPNRQQAPPGWPLGWQWGPSSNQNQQGWDQSGFGPGWNGGGQGWNGGGGGPGWNGGGGGPGWNRGGGRGPPPRPGWNGGGPPPRPGWNGGPPPPRPGWNGDEGPPPPPGPGWNGDGRPPPPPPPRPDWGGGPGWNGGPPPEWNNNQPDPNTNWDDPNDDNDDDEYTTTRTPPIVPTSTTQIAPIVQTTTPRPAETHPTYQPRPPTQPTKDTLIIGTNRPPLVPPQNPDPPTPLYPTWPVPQPTPSPIHSIEASEERVIVFPSSSKYIRSPSQEEVPSVPIDVRRR
ncbi:basic proline-rich protein [Drosophila biarmipes]|uniref:basic proline-rich protein n=1 Tax=Drosophila biarmipes TaxID=125945 RepID=UPI0007E7D088|nr:basic proline-rich protein [Drosophila biarmipes]